MENCQPLEADMQHRSRSLRCLARCVWSLGAMGMATGMPALAQQWPTQTVRVVVPFAAGGGDPAKDLQPISQLM